MTAEAALKVLTDKGLVTAGAGVQGVVTYPPPPPPSRHRAGELEVKLEQWARKSSPSYPRTRGALLIALGQLVQLKQNLEEDLLFTWLLARGVLVLGQGDEIEVASMR